MRTDAGPDREGKVMLNGLIENVSDAEWLGGFPQSLLADLEGQVKHTKILADRTITQGTHS